MSTAQRRMIDCREAAKRYGCSMMYIRKLAAKGRIKHEMLGGAYAFPESEVDRLIQEAQKATGRRRKRATGFKPG